MALNQFGQSVIKGMVDIRINPSVITFQHDPAAGADLVAGQLVKFSTAAGKLPVIMASTAKTDVNVGVVTYNPIKSAVKPGEPVEVACGNSVVYVEAGAAIARGVRVAWAANAKVVAAATTNVVAGVLLDPSSGDGSLVRMLIAGPFAPVVP